MRKTATCDPTTVPHLRHVKVTSSGSSDQPITVGIRHFKKIGGKRYETSISHTSTQVEAGRENPTLLIYLQNLQELRNTQI